MKLDLFLFALGADPGAYNDTNEQSTDYDTASMYAAAKQLQVVQGFAADAAQVFNSVSLGSCLTNSTAAAESLSKATECLSGTSGVSGMMDGMVDHSSKVLNAIAMYDPQAAILFKYLDEQFNWDDFGQSLKGNSAKTVVKELITSMSSAFNNPGASVILAFVREALGRGAKGESILKCLFGATWVAGKKGYEIIAADLEEYFTMLNTYQMQAALELGISEAEVMASGAFQASLAAEALKDFMSGYLGATAVDFVGTTLVNMATDLANKKTFAEAMQNVHWGQQALKSTVKVLCATAGAMIWPFLGKATGGCIGAVIADWAINNLNATDNLSADGWCGIGAGATIVGAGAGSLIAGGAALAAVPGGLVIVGCGLVFLLAVEAINDAVTETQYNRHLQEEAEKLGLSFEEVKGIREKQERDKKAAETGTTTTSSDKNGNRVSRTEYPNGSVHQVETYNNPKRTVTIDYDATTGKKVTKEVYEDGRTYVCEENTKTHAKVEYATVPDDGKNERPGSYRRITNADGTSTIIYTYADGSMETVNYDANGNRID